MSDEKTNVDEQEQVEDLEVKEGADEIVGGLNPQPLPPKTPPRDGIQ
jgi:hypothetical protein